MRKLLFFLLLIASSTSYASHIVGGEFELLHLSGDQYTLNLILYFDVNNGNQGARDANITARFFRKSDNAPMMDIFIPFIQDLRVEYFQPDCSNGEIVTDKLVYSTTISLPADIYNDPEGYYVSWERCCRNYSITNIFSEDPNNGGTITAGQTFYLEFPPVVKDDQPFINSSPQLFPPLNDYACPNRPYWVDFAGVDIDNDSLVYSLVTPLNTVTSQAIPDGGPHPGPYPSVSWRPGFDLENIMQGSPDLEISDKGFLRVSPQNQGLYVFAVKCEEFRDGVKIGEVIRDFQMLVLAQCPVADPPVIKGKKLNDAEFTFVDDMSITFPNTVADQERCIEIEVSDPDALKVEDGFSENIWLKVIAIDFETDLDISEILPSVSNATLTNGSVKSFQLCFDACPIVEGAPYTFGIIAFDDACALPLSDTLRVTVDIEAPFNSPAYFVTADGTTSIKEGNAYQLAIEGRDDQADDLTLDIVTDGFNLEDFGMSFDNTTNSSGVLNTTFNWATGCDIYDFTQRTNFIIKMILNDGDICDTGDPDTLVLDLEVILPPNTDPIISSNLAQLNFIHRLNEPLDFKVFGIDTDGDGLEMSVVGKDFNLEDFGMVFPPVIGSSQIESAFSWEPSCDNVSLEGVDNKEFVFYFLLNDLDKCKFPNHDSLEVKVTIIKPANTPPRFTFVNLNEEQVSFQARRAELNVGTLLRLQIIATDQENDNITLKLLPSSEMPNGGTFSDAAGTGTVKSILEWGAECVNLTRNFEARSYKLQFLATDDACYNAMADTVEIELNVEDIINRLEEFIPANVFTPNKDGVNDFYSLPDLPFDDCTGRFLSFRVHNRWGTEVFTTIDRDFRWEAEGLEAGVYYYQVEYTNRKYNGPLTILY